MSERCIDASAAIKWAVTEAESEKAFALLQDSLTENIALIAPPLFTAEMDSYVRHRVFNSTMTPEQGKQVYAALDAVAVQILDVPGLRERAREIAEQFHQKLVYDAQYAALADLRGCELWTADTRFYRVVKDDLPFVKHISDYR